MSKNKKKKKNKWSSHPWFHGSYGGGWRRDCHKGIRFVFKDPNHELRFYGAGSTRELYEAKVPEEYRGEWLFIDVGSRFFTPDYYMSNVYLPQFAQAIQKANENVMYLKIYWPDMQVPNVEKSGWEVLLSDIRNNTSIKKVLFSCMGGHGRTGTALAVMAGLTGVIDGDPVEYIRQNYCEEAVESQKQITYIEKITGLKVEAEPAKMYVSPKTDYPIGFNQTPGLWNSKETGKEKNYKPAPYATSNLPVPAGAPRAGATTRFHNGKTQYFDKYWDAKLGRYVWDWVDAY